MYSPSDHYLPTTTSVHQSLMVYLFHCKLISHLNLILNLIQILSSLKICRTYSTLQLSFKVFAITPTYTSPPVTLSHFIPSSTEFVSSLRPPPSDVRRVDSEVRGFVHTGVSLGDLEWRRQTDRVQVHRGYFCPGYWCPLVKTGLRLLPWTRLFLKEKSLVS